MSGEMAFVVVMVVHVDDVDVVFRWIEKGEASSENYDARVLQMVIWRSKHELKRLL